MKDVLLKAEDDENQEDGPGGSLEKAVRLHPQSPLSELQKRVFLFHERIFLSHQRRGSVFTSKGKCRPVSKSRSELNGSRG
jgi:hypothetical protein